MINYAGALYENTMDIESKQKAVARLIEGAWHEDELSVADELLAKDFVDHTSGFPKGEGPEAYKSLVRTVKSGFPDCRHPIDDMVKGDSEVAVRWRFVGTHEGEFLGISPTGRKVEIRGIEIFRFEDQVIAESWANPDMLGLVMQLGVDSVEALELSD